MSENKVYVAENMSFEEWVSFIKLFEDLESYSCTKIFIKKNANLNTWTVTLDDSEDIASLLESSFEDGILSERGWTKRFSIMEKTFVE